jgi:hypothetical protein
MAVNLAYSAADRAASATQDRPRRLKEFDDVTLPAAQRVEAKRIRIADIAVLLGQGEAGMGVALAPAITVARIARAHPDSLWGFWRHDCFVGGFAFLMLNRRGIEALIGDTLDLSDPPASALAAPGDRPAGIYVWALLRSSAVAAEGIARVIVRLQQFPYEHSDLFALPATADGLRFMCGLGFRPVPEHPRALHRYIRVANRKDQWGSS